MANNLIISYDLRAPGQNYDRVIETIKTCGQWWAKIHYSLFFVSSELTAQQALSRITAAADSNDTIFVVDAKNNNAQWFNIDQENTVFLQSHWNR